MAERNALERARVVLGEAVVGDLGLGERMLGRRQHISIECAVAGLNGPDESFGQFSRGERLFLQPVAGFGQRQRCQIRQSASFLFRCRTSRIDAFRLRSRG